MKRKSLPDNGFSAVSFTYRSPEANEEGWGLFDRGRRRDGSTRIEVARVPGLDGSSFRFSSDEAAWQHVSARASSGSHLHLSAFLLVKPFVLRWRELNAKSLERTG